jgi:uncharacterized membrane protein
VRNFELNDLEAVHFVGACLALVLGPLVLWLRKGTRLHIRVGYAYVACMLVVNVPVFFTYELFGRFGMFHGFAVMSLVSLTYGIGSAMARWPKDGWLHLHLSGMYWSVMGLYFAGIAQLMTTFRWNLTQVLVGAVCMAVVSTVLFAKNRKRWTQAKPTGYSSSAATGT